MYDKNKVEKKIRYGWIAGLITSGLTIFSYVMLYLLIGNRFWSRIEEMDVGIDVILTLLMLGLTVGIYNKNRAAAVIALVVFVLSRIVTWSAAFMMLSQSRNATGLCIGIPIGLILIRMFYLGVEGTFTYHRNIGT